MFAKNKNRGFTLIELLVVVAIVGILSSVVLASLNTARAKARDAKRKADFRQLSTAFNLYYDKFGVMPTVYAGGAPEVCEYVWGASQYVQMMEDMVNAGVLSSVVTGPGTQSWNRGYCYYDYGPNNDIGAIMVTFLEAAEASTGYPGSCRPWTGSNWCRSDTASKYYCVCNPY